MFTSLLFILFTASTASGQQNHFIYIQTDNKQPFYVRIKEKRFTATPAGYIIIPKIIDGAYVLRIGFPDNKWPAQDFPVQINNNDQGFLLKNFGASGWGLFNTNTLQVTMGATSQQATPGLTEKAADGFSDLLAEVTNTPVSPAPIFGTTGKVDSIKTPAPTGMEPSNGSRNDTVKSTVVNSNSNVALTPAGSSIKQVFTLLDSTGRSAVFVISGAGSNDTVRLFIPYRPLLAAAANRGELVISPAKDTTGPGNGVVAQDKAPAVPSAKEARPFITDVKVSDVATGTSSPQVQLINPSCKVTATEPDFVKLRRKMAAAQDDAAMLQVAVKVFRTKCFSTEQVKNVSLLFLTDLGKYNFFDAAYNYVSDPANFKTLQSQLSDDYYINRFRAMLR